MYSALKGSLIALMSVMFSFSATAKDASPQSRVLDSGWQVRLMPQDASVKDHTDAANWMPAHVPGAVQTDLMALGKLPDPYFGTNEANVQWVGLSGWQYRKSFRVTSADLQRGHLDLVFDGLDTFATVKLNGKVILHADNMFRRWRVPVKSLLQVGENHLEVDLASPIKVMAPEMAALPHVLPGAYDSAFGDEAPGRNSSSYVRKAGYHYGWDWGPRVVEIGIWKPVRLEVYDSARFADFHVAQIHLDNKIAALNADFDIVSDKIQQAKVTVEVTGPDGLHFTRTEKAELFAGNVPVSLPLQIQNPERWWPVGYGKADRYTVTATVQVGRETLGTITRKIGLRTVEIRREKDPWGRSFEIVVNGVPVFAKGANLIPFDMFPNRVTPAQQDAFLKSAVDANMNILRIWGGGTYQTDHLYDEADALGLMIWQDFMFGGAIIPYNSHFRENAQVEATQQVKRLRNHPSIILWAGNNEVQTDWENWGAGTEAYKKAITPEERDRVVTGMVRMFDNVLRSAVALNAPGTPYWASTPSTDYDGPADQDSDGDRHYWNVWGGKPVSEYLNITPRFMSEYGLQSFPVMATIRAFAGNGDLSLDNPVIHAHQKYDHGNGNTRLMFYIQSEYGTPKSFADFVYLSQVMQANGIELAATHLRASMPHCMGSMYWQLNDAWPGASWSSIDYYGRWKALQYHAKRFYAPVIITAIRKDGVTTMHVVSDEGSAKHYIYRLQVMDRDGKVLSDHRRSVDVPAHKSVMLDALKDADLLHGAAADRSYVVAELTDNGRIISRAVSYFVAPKAFALSDPAIRATLESVGDGYDLTLSAATLARDVWVDFGAHNVRLSDNAFDLLPGAPVTLHFTTDASLSTLRQALTVKSLYGAAQ